MPNVAKYGGQVDDKDVARWRDNLAAGSVITAEVYLRTLGLHCDPVHATPRTILTDASTKKFRDDFTDFVRDMEGKGKAGS